MSQGFLRLLLAGIAAAGLSGCDSGRQGSANGFAEVNVQPADNRTSPGRNATRSGYAQVRDGKIHFDVYGDPKPGVKPLLILHGSFMSGDAMQPLVDQFLRSRPVITLDARGHGRTGDLPGPITYEQLADDAAAVLRAAGVGKADVLGYSMGGSTAVFLAIRHPDLVDKQVILAGTSRRDGWYPEVLSGMARVTPAAMANSPMEKEYRRLTPTPTSFATSVQEIADLEDDYAASDDAVRAIPGKTMIIAGDADGVRLEHAVELFKLRGGGDRTAASRGFIVGAPKARLAILPATSHIGIIADVRQVASLVTPFLDDRPPPRATGMFEGMDVQAPPAPEKAEGL